MAHRIFGTSFAALYPLYVAKAEKKGRTRAEVDEVICWLTGHDAAGLADAVASGVDVGAFIADAPRWHPNAELITGVICGQRVEEIEDASMRALRQLDKLVDELARGKRMESILRAG